MPRKKNLLNLAGVLSLIAALWLLQFKLRLDLPGGNFGPVILTAVLSVLIFLLYLLKPLRQELALRGMYRRIMHRVRSGAKNRDEDENSGRNRFLSAFETLKIEGVDLRYYPVLAVIGTDQDDVHALVTQANLTPVQGEAPLEPINSLIDGHSFRWWIAREAILIDLSPCFSKAPADGAQEDGAADSIKTTDWNGLGPILRQLDEKLVDGVITVFSAKDIETESDHKSKELALRLRAQLNAIAKSLDRRTPVYLFANHAESIDGFTEYLKYCAGPTKDETIGFNGSGSRYADHYNLMLSRLYRRLPGCIAAVPTKAEKLRLNAFPHLLSTLFNPLHELSRSIVNDKTCLVFAGLYFTSADSEHPFSEAAFKQIIQRHRTRLAPVEPSGVRLAKVGALSLALLALAAWAFILFDTYRFNKALFSKKAAELRKFAKTRRPSPYSFTEVLAYLERVRALSRIPQAGSHGPLPRIEMPLSKRMREHLAGYYRLEVNRVFPSALAHFFERHITTNEIKGVAAYKALIAYQSLKRFKDGDREVVLDYLQRYANLRKNPSVYRAVVRYFRVLQPEQVRKQVRLNYIIVNELQSKVDDSLLLKLMDREIVRQLSGMKHKPVLFSSLFEQPVVPYIENINAPEIPYLYTTKGYARYLTAIDIALQKLRRSSWVLQKGGLPEKRLYELKKSLLTSYIKKYLAFWRAAVDGVRIKPLRSREHAIVFLNTVRRYPDFVAVFSDYALKHLRVITLKSQSEALIEEIQRLKKHSRLLDRSGRLYAALKEKDESRVVHLINELKAVGPDDAAGKAFFTHLARQLNRALFDDERGIMTAAYQDKVLSLCRTLVTRYPFNRKAKKTSRLSQFRLLFAADGRIERFFDHYLKKYITKEMKLNEEGRTLGINPGVINLLQSARRIRKNIFYKNRIRVRYRLKPKLLDNRANQILVEMGRKKFNYRHGAQLAENVTWPPSGRKKKIRFAFYLPGRGVVSGKIKTSDWTFFRMAERALGRGSSLVFKSGPYQAEYSVYLVDTRKYRNFKKLAQRFRCAPLFSKPRSKTKEKSVKKVQ